MHINDPAPQRGSPDSNISRIDTRKRHHLMEDDNTFVPPALSAYGLALLSDKSRTPGQHALKHPRLADNEDYNNNAPNEGRDLSQVTGIYEVDFPERNQSRNNLRNKLSVHFKESVPALPIVTHKASHQTSYRTPNQVNSSNDEWNSNYQVSDSQRRSSSNNISQGSINDFQNQSHNNNSLHNSFNMSYHNQSNNQTHNTTSEEHLDTADVSSEHSNKFSQTNTNISTNATTTPGSSGSPSTIPRPTSTNSSSQIGSIKRSRLARRFRSLGPPKRAPKSYDNEKSTPNAESSSSARPVIKADEAEIKGVCKDNRIGATPPHASTHFSPNIESSVSSKSPKSASTSFFKALEKLKSESPREELFSKHREMEIRNRIEEQKKLNELEHQLSKSKPIRSLDLEIEDLNKSRARTSKDDALKPLSKRSKVPVYKEEYDESGRFANTKVNDNKENSLHVEELPTFKNNFKPLVPMTINDHNLMQSRIPLTDVPVNTFNVFNDNKQFNDNDNFRKPKLPRSHLSPVKSVASTEHNSPPPLHDQASLQRQQGSQSQPQPQSHNMYQQPERPQQIVRPSSIQSSAPSTIIHNPPDEVKKRKAMTINGNQYEKLELLGRGGTSKVYKVKALFNNKLYAIKKVTFDQFEESCVKGFKGEIDLLLKLKDASRVVKLVDHAVAESSVCLVMECGDIDLAHVLQNKLGANQSLDANFIRFHAIEILKCVQAVHQADIVHSDLKPANFLFVKGILKIIDFGIANAVPDHTANIYRESQIGTPNYMAPEALTEVNQSLILPESGSNRNPQTWRVGKPSDVWSCGCIIYQMIYGKPPYAGYSSQQRIMAIMNPHVRIQYPVKGLGGTPVPTSAIELMHKCLARNPNDRWTVEECLSSDFLSPKVVSEAYVRDLVHSAVDFGFNYHVNGETEITDDVYDKLIESVMKQIEDLHYA